MFWKLAKNNLIYHFIPLAFTLGFSYLSYHSFGTNYFWLFLALAGFSFFKSFGFFRTLKILFNIRDSQGAMIPTSYTTCKFGQARSGKTLTSVISAFTMSQIKWSKLQQDYFIFKKRSQIYENQQDKVFMTRYLELEKAYSFWSTHPQLIPCLLSNVKIRCGEQISLDLTREHFDQKLSAPSFSVWLLDEVGRFFDLKESNVNLKVYESVDLMCFIGQFLETHLIMTEQRPTNFPTDYRGVTGSFESIEIMQKVNEANFGYWVYEKLLNFAIAKKLAPKTFERLHKIKTWLDQVGFFKFEFLTLGNIDFSRSEPKKRVVLCLKNFGAEYDSRAYQNLYLAKDFEIDDTVQNFDLLVDETSLIAKKMYSRYQKEEKKNGKI